MKKVICKLLIATNEDYENIKIFLTKHFGFQSPENNDNWLFNLMENMVFVIDLKDDLPYLDVLNEIKELQRNKRYMKHEKSEPLFSVHRVSELGISLYGVLVGFGDDSNYTGPQEYSLFLPWNSVTAIRTFTEKECERTLEEIKKAPYLHR